MRSRAGFRKRVAVAFPFILVALLLAGCREPTTWTSLGVFDRETYFYAEGIDLRFKILDEKGRKVNVIERSPHCGVLVKERFFDYEKEYTLIVTQPGYKDYIDKHFRFNKHGWNYVMLEPEEQKEADTDADE